MLGNFLKKTCDAVIKVIYNQSQSVNVEELVHSLVTMKDPYGDLMQFSS